MPSIRLLACLAGIAVPFQVLAQPPAAVESVADSLLKEFDRDADGKLNRKELQAALRSLASEDESDAELRIASAEESVLKAPKFIRVKRDKRKRPISLDTSIVTYKSRKSNAQIDLIGAVHVGDQSYYDALNKRFRDYDVLLYELVAPEGARVPQGGGKSQHPVGQMQQGLKSMLELEYQLEKIDYHAKNFVHADMTPEEFSKSMKDRNESFLQIMFRMMGQASAQQSKGDGPSDFDLLFALFSKDRARRLKQAMAVQFEDIEGQMKALQGPEGSTLISERNKKALAVLKKQLANGKKKIGIFYGAGHFPDMSKRLADDFGFVPVSENWLEAWDMRKK